MYRRAVLIVMSLLISAAAAYGADDASPTAGPSSSLGEALSMTDVVNRPLGTGELGSARRPAALPILYGGFIVLQGVDAYSTTVGLSRGAHEANPMMQGVAGNKAAFWAVKAGSTAASIWLVERLWKKNRVGAVVTMVAVNSMMASVAARNASVLRAAR